MTYPKPKKIRNEKDVRNWVRSVAGYRLRWVEPSMGSTSGLPDCWVPALLPVYPIPLVVNLELKSGEIRDNVLRYEVRPEQKREIRAMRRDCVPVGILVGVEGTESLIFSLPNEEAIGGRIRLAGEGTRVGQRFHATWRAEEDWNAGVRFILFETYKRAERIRVEGRDDWENDGKLSH